MRTPIACANPCGGAPTAAFFNGSLTHWRNHPSYEAFLPRGETQSPRPRRGLFSRRPVESRTMPRLIGAIDQGTTSTRFLILEDTRTLRAFDQREHRQIYPQPGWVEHDAAEIWTNTQAVIHGALTKAGLTAGDLSAIGVTNQRETTVLWNRATGAPLHPALVWMEIGRAHV